MVVDAVVRGERLLLPDYVRGLREIDLVSGKDLRSVVPMGTRRGQVLGPQHLGCDSGRCVVWGSRYYWIYFNHDWQLIQEHLALETSPTGQPLVFSDRMVVFGVATAKLTGGGSAYLFIQYDDGTCVPLQEFSPTMPMVDKVKQIHFQGVTSGGLAALPDGGWLFVDPRTYTVFVFNETDRLTGTFQGRNPRFRRPNWAAYEVVHDDSGRESFFRWHLAQVLVKRPVVLGDRIAVVVGIPDGAFRQRHELDLYRLDGTPVAIGVPIPGVSASRLIVADADGDRLVLVGQDGWQPESPTTVWQVRLKSSTDPG